MQEVPLADLESSSSFFTTRLSHTFILRHMGGKLEMPMNGAAGDIAPVADECPRIPALKKQCP
jgi:hypothetical protein